MSSHTSAEPNLAGQVALVTGAGRGIGRAVACMLGQAGAHVILTARTASQLERVRDTIVAAGGQADGIPADLLCEEDILALFKTLATEHKHLDILINNAGLGVYGPTDQFATADVDRVLGVNLRAAFLCCREALKLMIPAQRGYVINIASVVGFKGYPLQAAYTASKHGVVGLTKSLAAEAQSQGIRFSVVEPGGTDTEMVRQARPDIPSDELMHPDDVAGAVAYLLSLSERAAVDEIYIRRRNSKPF